MDLSPLSLPLGAIWFAAFLFSTTLHEAGHAFAAWRLGDPTAYEGGQMTLDPLPHIRREPFGMLLVPIASFFFYGWMMGWASAPYDPAWAARHPRRSAAMALAGPAGNLLLVLLCGAAMRVGLGAGWLVPPDHWGFTTVVAAAAPGPTAGVAVLLSVLYCLNLLLLTFNLLPVPPLDGSGVVPALLPARAAAAYLEATRRPWLSLLGIVVAWRLFGPLFGPIFGVAIRALYGGL